MPIDEILNELEKQTKLSREELIERVDGKQKELSGLVTREGAAHLIARELGVNLLDENRRRLDIKNIVAGMRNVNAIGRIFRISDIVEFKRSDGSDGRVVNLFVGDSTGFVRLPLWNDQVKLVEDETVRLGDVIQIVNGFARENVFGDVEVSLGRFGSIRPVEDAELPNADELASKFFAPTSERASIRDIALGNVEIKATIAHIFRSKFLFNVCSVCGGKLEGDRCSEHGEAEPKPALVIAAIADDGTGNMRVTFFRSLAEKAIDTSAEELAKLDEQRRYELINEKLVGKELLFYGRVRKNKLFDRLELIVNDFKDLNILEESEKLVSALKSRIGESKI